VKGGGSGAGQEVAAALTSPSFKAQFAAMFNEMLATSGAESA
ncbi:MAG: hypothetical protein JWM74_230, partial [Myxococcaceae bacterium]|nr:hypothetical protein [Myxococcaceae bacterium]